MGWWWHTGYGIDTEKCEMLKNYCDKEDFNMSWFTHRKRKVKDKIGNIYIVNIGNKDRKCSYNLSTL